MPLAKAFLLPHSPLLIPEIGRANHSFLEKTAAAYQKAAEAFKEAGVETIIIFSPHNSIRSDYFIINAAPEMELNFTDFGFIPNKINVKNNILLADAAGSLAKDGLPVRTESSPNLDHGSAIPLYLLKGLLSDFKVLVISSVDSRELEDHFSFGAKLAEALAAYDKPIAVIASGDLSHRLKRKSPGGYSPKGAKFDNRLIEYLSEAETARENILKMDKRLISDASECGLKPLSMLLGLLGDRPWEADVLAYQTDFGIGYLSLEFLLKDQAPADPIS